MKYLPLSLLLAFCFTPAFAQVYDGGVNDTTDEFTGQTSCRHYVDESMTTWDGITLVKSSSEFLPGLLVHVRRSYEGSDWVLNSAGAVTNTTLYMIFGDSEPVNYPANYVSVETEENYEALSVMSTELANRVMASPGDIKVRFSGPNGSADFVIDHAVATTLAAGFGQECLP
jgi:hypothetical protein